MFPTDRSSQQGQAIALFAGALVVIVLAVAVVVDGGYAFAQRRASQNAADFAAIAGTRIVGQSLTGRPAGTGTAANVEASIDSILSANGANLVSATYVDDAGLRLGSVVGASSIPAGAFGVVVEARTDWKPFLLGVIGITDWAATSTATAITPGASVGGGVLPVGIHKDTYDDLADCEVTALNDCMDDLTPGSLIEPGNFGWLSFGLQGNGGKCDWTSSLGMVPDGGCQVNQPFLDSQIGPPSDTHGCCTEVEVEGEDKIGGLTGNEWGDLSYYIDNQIPVWVPVYDTTGGQGSKAWYDIVGFGAIIFADTGDGSPHAKWLKGKAVNTPWCARPDHAYCKGPGGAFTVDVTGDVQLVR